MNTSPWKNVLPIALGVFLGIMSAFIASLFILGIAADQAQQQAQAQTVDLLEALGRVPAAPSVRVPASSSVKPPLTVSTDTRPPLPGSKLDMKPGTLACHFGFMNVRTRDGWKPVMRDGKAQPCRSTG